MNVEPLGRLVNQARLGSDLAFAEIVCRFQRSLTDQAVRILRDAQLAEDAVQEAWGEAHRKLGDLRSNAAFASWMSRIVFKYCDRILRKPAEVTIAPNELARIKDLRQTDEPMVRHDVDQLLAKLPALDRAIALQFFREGRAQADIALDLDIPLHTVKNRIRRTRQAFQDWGNPGPRSMMRVNVMRMAA